MSGRTDTERLEWLIQCIKTSEAAILETIYDFELEGKLSEARAANDALDALRSEFPVWISELSVDKINEGMDIQRDLIELVEDEKPWHTQPRLQYGGVFLWRENVSYYWWGSLVWTALVMSNYDKESKRYRDGVLFVSYVVAALIWPLLLLTTAFEWIRQTVRSK